MQNLGIFFYTKCLLVQSDKFFHLRHVKTKYSRKALKGRLMRSSKGLTWEDYKKFPSKHSRFLGVRWYRLYFWAPWQLLKPSQSIKLFLGFQADYRICMLSQALSRPILQNDLTKTSFLLFPLLWNHLPMQWGDALSVCSLGSRPARVLLSQPNQHAWSPQKVFQCHNTLTHFKNTGSMSQCWPCTAGTELWQRNSSWKNSFVDPQLLRHTFWVQASNNYDYSL